MLEVHHLSCQAGGRTLLDAVSAQFDKGCVTGLLGPNGAGKSTLLKVTAGLVPACAGKITLDGYDIQSLTTAQLARQLAYIPQDNPPLPAIPVCEIISLGRLPYGETGSRAIKHYAVENALKATGLADLAQRRADQLSGGEKARLMLARALATEAEIILADEVMAALDPAHALSVMQILRSQAEAGRCVVLVIHDLLMATRFCDNLVLISDGKVQASLSPADLTDTLVQNVYGVTTRKIGAGLVPWNRV
ncbi:ABC transporter ATP-binding protein [Acetobacter thailandicus]|uniref:ABC transporter ATP-binding protein n=1 Tax=Acetobacter thailandicus TaxID=1502842 RepID=UPI001BA80D36|nr:ABC transporter ATP-binding protein [Acetobacter thailandicus]MBS0986523.1 ABC transporter ATP-binding protein [Acetobacter thailandicus]